MVTREDVLGALRGVIDPELGGNIVELGMVSDVSIGADGKVDIGIALTIAECPMRGRIESDTARKVEAMPGVTKVHVHTTAMTKAQRANVMSVARHRARENAEPTQLHPNTRVIAVGSGKGGVGKSTVTVNLAAGLRDRGYLVGVLDADIWGFSIPRMLGSDQRLEANDETRLIVPAEVDGIRVVSTGMIIDSEETALMWRGLMLSKALEQFLKQVDWGPLDYLLIDLPPGTGDIQMALSRMLPQAELLVVTTPQAAARKVAVRVADMARRSYLPVIGVVENMADFVCEHGTSYPLFGSGGGDALSADLGVPLVGSIPVDAAVVAGGDSGKPVVTGDGPAASAFSAAVDRILELVPPAQDETSTGRIARLLESLPEPALATD